MPPDFSSDHLPAAPVDRWQAERTFPLLPHPSRLWVHALLFLATLATTTLVGAHMQYNFAHNLPFFQSEDLPDVFLLGIRRPETLLSGLPFSLTLLLILTAHELGHYFACVYYGVDATLPFFLPAPTPVSGTFGAFIRIRAPINSKKVLYDIGISGPLAGFLFVIPALAIGLAFSKVVPGINLQSSVQPGTPGILWLFERAIFSGVPGADIYLHPIARAAWVGAFATGLNLLPAGQLDGGHIVYAMFGRVHRWISLGVVAALVGLGFYWWPWWLWAGVLLIFARKHPAIFDNSDPGKVRTVLFWVALVVLGLCFILVPEK